MFAEIPEHFFETVSSTMEVARDFAATAAGDIFRIRTHHQRAGRGRRGRIWYNLPGEAVLMTIALRRGGAFDPGDTNPGIMALRTGATVTGVVTQFLPPERPVRIKWPNDILIDNRKVAGILIEGDPRWYYIGVGINTYRGSGPQTWTAGPAPPPASLREFGDIPAEDVFLAAFDRLFFDYVKGERWRPFVESHLAWRGRDVSVDTGEEGTITGIGPDGALLLKTPSGVVSCYAGTIRLLGGKTGDKTA